MPRAKSGINFFFAPPLVGPDAVLNTSTPNKILSIPIDSRTIESTVTITLAENAGNPNSNTTEDNMSEIKPDPICIARNQLGVLYLSKAS